MMGVSIGNGLVIQLKATHFDKQINVWHKFDLLSTPQSRLRNLRVT
jgi:hypothetical protein